jgi:hypothetical protein
MAKGTPAMMFATTTIASRAIDATTTAVTVTAMRHAMTGIVTGSAAIVMTARLSVVHDYGHYRLRPPPRGYHWVRADNDYLLVGIATGIILDMALH